MSHQPPSLLLTLIPGRRFVPFIHVGHRGFPAHLLLLCGLGRRPPPRTRRPCGRSLVPATAFAGRGRGGLRLAHHERSVLGTLLDGLAQLRIQEGISFIRLSSMTLYKSAKKKSNNWKIHIKQRSPNQCTTYGKETYDDPLTFADPLDSPRVPLP